MSKPYVCIHGHFYQPPRQDPFTSRVRREPGAAPYHDFNEKIAAECYRPNAEHGNFGRISFDLGPTLASWLELHESATLAMIQAEERDHRRRSGASNAMAQPYNHSILPLATAREKQIQIAWGLADYVHRYGHAPAGMWLPETAVDLPTLRALADAGIAYTILAPWQAATPIDPSEPYRVDLGDGRDMTVFFYQAALSGGISFNQNLTVNADQFSADQLPSYMNREKRERGTPQLLLIATDGELYGHHQPFRDLFLQYLLTVSAPRNGWEITSLGDYLRRFPPLRRAQIHERTSWSCHHGIDRWDGGCGCTAGDSAWKGRLRQALRGLAEELDAHYEQVAAPLLADPWATLAAYLPVRLGSETLATFLRRQAGAAGETKLRALGRALEMQYYRQLMFTSCGFFFEDLDRLEPANNIAYAARAVRLLPPQRRRRLEQEFLAALASARSGRSGRSGADLYRAALATADSTPDASQASAA